MEKSMKKRYMYAVACSLLWSAQAMAQTSYDAVRYAGDELNGTARFVGMGGAWELWERIFPLLEQIRLVLACLEDMIYLLLLV